uniref:Pept_C1 domain-containing protein n=1 Tax=Caenorhabditis japonica TaxID=281687 RepID=A0A8R1DSY9_CAEJA
MKFVILATLVAFTAGLVLPNIPAKLSGQALTEYVNSKQSLWKASIPKSISLEQVKRRLMNTKFVAPHADEDILVREEIEAAAIPDSFDARQQWPNCQSIGNIRDQSDCGSCWAFAAAEAASDRFCIQSNGTVNTLLSAEDVLSCCSSCGYGCEGGYPIEAWRYLVKTGFVTGGSYEAQFGCKPYSIPPCSETVGNITYPECPEDGYDTPKCVQKCTNANYNIAFKDDKHYGATAYAVGKKVAQIQAEILAHGPVEVAFTVYEDFYQYTSGVYVHTSGEELGGHAVRILGWGTENGTPYWLVANSWNVAWGENGYFRIIRGTNECGIEHAVVGGIPKV